MRVASGTYTGDGLDARYISGLGFAPDFVIVMGTGSSFKFLRARTHRGDAGKRIDSSIGAVASNSIQEVRPDGFVVGSAAGVNGAASTYYYLAVQEDPRDCKVLSYIGDGVDGRAIDGIGFQPDVVLIYGDVAANDGSNSTVPVLWLRTVSAGETLRFDTAAGTADMVQAIRADGFELGTRYEVNGAGQRYHALCLKEVPGLCAVVSYTGTGSDNLDVTGVGFTSDFVLVQGDTAQRTAMRFEDHAGDTSQLVATAADTANVIQSVAADGFQVGTHATVNTLDVVYHALCLAEGATGSGLVIALANDQVTVNLHDSPYGVRAEAGGGLGWPLTNRVFAEPFSRGYHPLTGVSYGNREEAEIPLHLTGTSLDGWALAYRHVERILLETQRYWASAGAYGLPARLWVQLNGMSNPTLYDVKGGELRADDLFRYALTRTAAPAHRGATLRLILKPWGRPVDLAEATSASISNGRGTGDATGVYRLSLPAGDVEAPARVELRASSGTDVRRWVVARRTRGNVANFRFGFSAESTEAGYDVTTSGNSSLSWGTTTVVEASAESGGVRRLSTASGTGAGVGPASTGTYTDIVWTLNANVADFYGTHRGLVRIDRTSGGSGNASYGWQAQLLYGGASGDGIANDRVEVTPGTASMVDFLIDLGSFSIPHRAGPLDAPLPSFAWRVRFRPTSAATTTGAIDVDSFYMLPIDEQLVDVELATGVAGTTGDRLVIDNLAPTPLTYLTDASGEVQPERLSPLADTKLSIMPGVDNLFLPLLFDGTSSGPIYHGHNLADSLTVNARYYPQYALLRGT